MSCSSPSRLVTTSSLRSLAAIALSLLLPGQMLPAQALPAQETVQPLHESTPASQAQPVTKAITKVSQRTSPAQGALKLDSDQRILHLLNRFTFGPTPEDVAIVKSLGPNALNLWFEQQLHPERLPDPQLNARLADYPAMQLPVDQILQRFPSGAEIRQAANGKRPIPRNGYLAAIYRRHVDLYEEKQAKKAEEKTEATQAKPAANNSAMAAQPGEMAGAAMTQSAAKPDPKPDTKPEVDPSHAAYSEVQLKSLLNLAPADRVSRILAMQPAEYDQLRSSLKGPQKTQLVEDMNAGQRELLADFDNPSKAVVEELQDQRLLRDIYSTHQLQEVMTTFWLNHFNVYLRKNEEAPYYLVSYERDVIRPHALGNFESLLVATAQSPAMLQYLDNSSSTGPHSTVANKFEPAMFGKQTKTAPGLNENYARELMELHTLGVNGGYTQKDVTEVARIFTGWTVDKPQQGGGSEFDPTRHDPGKKLVMGHVFKENGQREGLQLLHMLATSPATAHFISQELATTFVSDTPAPAMVNRMAQSFLRTNGDIPSVLRTMLHSPEFWTVEAYQAKVKTPLEYVVSSARASGAQIDDPRPLVNALNQMGMPLYACVPPTGYSWKADAWVSTGALVTRMNFALSLATNRYNGIKPDWSAIAQQSNSAAEAEQTLEARLIPEGVSERTRAAVLNQALNQAQNQAQNQGQTQTQPPAQPPAQPAENQSKVPSKTQTSPSAEPVSIASKPVAPPSQTAAQATAQASAQDRQNAQIAGLLLGSPEFQRR